MAQVMEPQPVVSDPGDATKPAPVVELPIDMDRPPQELTNAGTSEGRTADSGRSPRTG